jgi:hypothetical protein
VEPGAAEGALGRGGLQVGGLDGGQARRGCKQAAQRRLRRAPRPGAMGLPWLHCPPPSALPSPSASQRRAPRAPAGRCLRAWQSPRP